MNTVYLFISINYINLTETNKLKMFQIYYVSKNYSELLINVFYYLDLIRRIIIIYAWLRFKKKRKKSDMDVLTPV